MNLRFEQTLDVPRDALFAFHTNPAHLAALLDGWPGFELRSHDGHIRPGARVAVRQRVGPLWFGIVMEQFLYEPPARFGERLVAGPFRRFEHVHEFEECGSGTKIVDRLSFALPWWRGGPLAERWIVARTVRRFFAVRRAAYERLLAAGRFGPGGPVGTAGPARRAPA